MSYTCLYYHIVFSTKERRQYLNDEQVQAVCKYIGGILRNQKGTLLTGNGMPDHLHLAASLHPSLALSDFIRDIKVASSKWIPEKKILHAFDGWQKGYSAFTHAVNDKNRLIQYIIRQKEHHRKLTFKEELINLLKQAQIEFDMKYLA